MYTWLSHKSAFHAVSITSLKLKTKPLVTRISLGVCTYKLYPIVSCLQLLISLGFDSFQLNARRQQKDFSSMNLKLTAKQFGHNPELSYSSLSRQTCLHAYVSALVWVSSHRHLHKRVLREGHASK